VRRFALALALVAATAARAEAPVPATSAPAPEEKTPQDWEVDLFVGYGQLAYPALDTANLGWSNGGAGFALTFAYRGPHFTHPFFDISYVPIISSGKTVYATTAGGQVVTTWASNSNWAWGFVLGPGWDIDWFRFRVGVGLYDVLVKTTVGGVTNTISQFSVGFLGAASALVWRPEPFAVGVEFRMVALQMPFTGIYQSAWEAGITGRWDFVHVK